MGIKSRAKRRPNNWRKRRPNNRRKRRQQRRQRMSTEEGNSFVPREEFTVPIVEDDNRGLSVLPSLCHNEAQAEDDNRALSLLPSMCRSKAQAEEQIYTNHKKMDDIDFQFNDSWDKIKKGRLFTSLVSSCEAHAATLKANFVSLEKLLDELIKKNSS